MNTANMPVIELNGTPRERGHCYGESAKALIAETIVCWRDNLSNFGLEQQSTHAVDVNAYLQAFLAETNFTSAIERWTPDLLEEIKGIAEGPGQPFNDILGLQLVDEEWVFAFSIIYEFGNVPRLHLAAGRPCETAFKVFDFKTHVSGSSQ